MSVKRKLTKAEFDALSDELKAHYKVGSGADEYILDADDATELQNAVARQKQEAADNKRRADGLQTQLDEIKEKFDKAEADKIKAEEEKAKAAGDIPALTAQWEKKLADAKLEADKEKEKLRNMIRGLTKEKDAMLLATELAGENAELLLPHILSRMDTDFEGDVAQTIILGVDGKRSVDKPADLKKEFLENKKFAAIVVGSKADGGAGKSGSPASIGKSDLEDFSKLSDADRIKLWKENPTKFDQLVEAQTKAKAA